MKKLFLLLGSVILGLSLAACTQSSKSSSDSGSSASTVTFHALNGNVKIPAHPTRIAVQNYPDEVLSLGGNVVGTDSWSVVNPYLSKKLSDLGAPKFNLEKLIEEKPDLIITVDKDQVADYQKIAPTVLVNYQDLAGLNKSLDFFAKLLNRKTEEKTFLANFDKTAEVQKKRLSAAGVIPSKLTASIIELSADKIYAYGSDFARGGQALTRGLGFSESPAMADLTKGVGYAELNAESLGKFDADYIFVDYKTADSSQFQALQQNPVWQSMKAVKNKHVVIVDYDKVYFFGGPTASEKQMSLYVDAILKQTK
ncbi:MAG: ABC transporter substrate-binding protein [Streptococcaceae bacterium]|jgi:iron complex transport system substrate-binding protein|nr:ABC transporter substrate-binding protein [Streptococcaceae bacterium]